MWELSYRSTTASPSTELLYNIFLPLCTGHQEQGDIPSCGDVHPHCSVGSSAVPQLVQLASGPLHTVPPTHTLLNHSTCQHANVDDQ